MGGRQSGVKWVSIRQESEVQAAVLDRRKEALEIVQSRSDWRTAEFGWVNITQRRWKVLHLAVWAGDAVLVKKLLALDCNPRDRDALGDSPLSLAHELRDFSILAMLRSEDSHHVTVTDLAVDVESTGCERTVARDEQDALFAVSTKQNSMFPKAGKRPPTFSIKVQPITSYEKP